MSTKKNEVTISQPLFEALKNDCDLKALVYPRLPEGQVCSRLISDDKRTFEVSAATLSEYETNHTTALISFDKKDVKRLKHYQDALKMLGAKGIIAEDVGHVDFDAHQNNPGRLSCNNAHVYDSTIEFIIPDNVAGLKTEMQPIDIDDITSVVYPNRDQHQLSYSELIEYYDVEIALNDEDKISVETYNGIFDNETPFLG